MPIPQLYAVLVDSSGNPLTAVPPLINPGGRLTLSTNVPVLGAAVATSANVLYTPYVGNYIPLWNGTNWIATVFTELTNVLANSAVGNAGPAAAIASSNYDLFVWNNGGTPTLTRGGVWFSATARSTATENDLQRIQGLLCNLNAITNGPGVGAGLYVGTVRTDAGGATVSWSPGGAGANGVLATLNVWNMYNRRNVTARVQDTTASWNYTSATVQAFNNSPTNRVNFIRGLNEEPVVASLMTRVSVAAAALGFTFFGLGLDDTASYTLSQSIAQNVLAAGEESAVFPASYAALPGLGFHFLSANNSGDGTNASTIYGNLYMNYLLSTTF